jgi:hypothetical protein
MPISDRPSDPADGGSAELVATVVRIVITIQIIGLIITPSALRNSSFFIGQTSVSVAKATGAALPSPGP